MKKSLNTWRAFIINIMDERNRNPKAKKNNKRKRDDEGDSDSDSDGDLEDDYFDQEIEEAKEDDEEESDGEIEYDDDDSVDSDSDGEDDDAVDVLDCSIDDLAELIHIEDKQSKGTLLMSTEKKSITISSSRLLFAFNLLVSAFVELESDPTFVQTTKTSEYLKMLFQHAKEFVTPLNQFNSGDARPFLKNLTFYTRFFDTFGLPNVTKAMGITLQRFNIWKTVPGIMEMYLSNCQKFNEVHIEHFNSTLQRQLPVNKAIDFDTMETAAQRAATNYSANKIIKDVLKSGTTRNNNTQPESMKYKFHCDKDRQSIDIAKNIIRKVFKFTNTAVFEGPSTKKIDLSASKRSKMFTQKSCRLTDSEKL